MANEYLNNKKFESIIVSFQFFKRQKVRQEMIIEDLDETHQRRFIKYGDDQKKEALEVSQKEYNRIHSEYKTCQEQLAYAFFILSENIANYAKFNGVDVDDAIQEGVVTCFEKVDRFNPNFTNKNGQKAKAFNYLTTCIINSLRQQYRTNRTFAELKKRYSLHLFDSSDSNHLIKRRDTFFMDNPEK